MVFETAKKISIFDNIVEQIRSKINSGEISPGQKLPSERELAAVFNVSRSTIREAIRALAFIGFLEVRQGEGTFIPKDMNRNLLATSIHSLLVSNKKELEELLDTRLAIEIQIVRLATERIRSENLERLNEICRKHRGTTEIGEKSQWDVEFHLEIARGSGNSILFNIEEGLRKRMENMTKTLLMSDESNRAVHREHELILRCLEKRDRDQAMRAMENHLNHAKKIMLKIITNTHVL